MIDRRKELAQVALQNAAVATGESLAVVQRRMGAFAHPVGVGILNERLLKDRLNNAHQCVMDHPVAEGSGRDQAMLGVADMEGIVRTMVVALGLQFLLQAEEIFLQIELESGHVWLPPLAPGCLLERLVQVFEGRDFWIQALVPLHSNIPQQRPASGGI